MGSHFDGSTVSVAEIKDRPHFSNTTKRVIKDVFIVHRGVR